ncbi:MAG: glucosaminidase domain-containing protein [Verrucomicrobia bacterium]|nr:glucosaminidase domain-containing protein [Verrucomicrobiota bacterium]
MKNWLIFNLLVLGLPATMHASEESFRIFRSVDPARLEGKVPAGYGRVFVEAGRANSIDPILLAAISAHESGAWKSAAACHKNNWMGLMTRCGTRRFASSEQSIYYAAELLNRRPFRGHNTLSELASIYCATNPSYWRQCVLKWERMLVGGR